MQSSANPGLAQSEMALNATSSAQDAVHQAMPLYGGCFRSFGQTSIGAASTLLL